MLQVWRLEISSVSGNMIKNILLFQKFPVFLSTLQIPYYTITHLILLWKRSPNLMFLKLRMCRNTACILAIKIYLISKVMPNSLFLLTTARELKQVLHLLNYPGSTGVKLKEKKGKAGMNLLPWTILMG